MEGGSSFGRPRQRQASHGKRTHDQMEAGHRRSPSPLFVRPDSLSSERDTPPPPRPNPHIILPPLRQPARFAGDGLDHRTPVSSFNYAPNVIDLTDDDDSMTSNYTTPQPDLPAPPPRTQRLPRFSREIIDLSADTSPPEPRHPDLPRQQAPYARSPPQQNARPRQHNPNMAAIRSSPEVQFVSERPRSPRTRVQERIPTPFEQLREPENRVLDLTVDLDDDVVHVRTEGRAGINLQGPHGRLDGLGARNDFGVGRIVEFMRNAGAARPQWPGLRHIFAMGHQPWDDEDGGDEGTAFLRRNATRRAAQLPGGMDYTTLGFGMVEFEEAPPRPPTPKYSPPPDPGPGFTRSPEEDGELICPNCKDELGLGESDEKKQVWIIKACGHVYCGQCMLNRKSKNKGKAKITDPAIPPPFSTCQVPDCNKKTTQKTQVMQIFL